MSQRPIIHHYQDPVDLIWIRAAADLGLRIKRSTEVFASYDGDGTLTISEESDFDADDCLAQMIFHEICHWLVAGRKAVKLEDWGLSNLDDRDLVYEYAVIRLQAALARPFGLREFMAVTTDWRPYWEALPEDSLKDGSDPAIPIAQEAAHLARLEPFKSVLERSLSATAAIADVVREAVKPLEENQLSNPHALWSVTRPRHRLGSLMALSDDLRCGACAWASSSKVGLSCVQHKDADGNCSLVDSGERACEKWEKEFSIEDCGSCGACCREGFDLLTVSADDPFVHLHSELVQLREDGERFVPRPNGVCVALDGDGETSPYRCRHYGNRPKNCGDFEVAGEACLIARRRVGLSR